jgi:hypothetical protein
MADHKFRKLPQRRTAGSPAQCRCGIDSGLSATAFGRPTESVLRASRSGLFHRDLSFLEIGGGNLRNALFVQQKFRPKRIVVFERSSVIARFGEEYEMFQQSGGLVRDSLPRSPFDTIVMTYVLETICPPTERDQLLRNIANLLHPNSRLILSVRGYPGVRGKHYRRCPYSDGWISPLRRLRPSVYNS